jgi:hypothetical protein
VPNEQAAERLFCDFSRETEAQDRDAPPTVIAEVVIATPGADHQTDAHQASIGMYQLVIGNPPERLRATLPPFVHAIATYENEQTPANARSLRRAATELQPRIDALCGSR